MRNTLIIAYILSFSGLAHADFKSSNEARIGFTDNANLERVDKDSDLLWRIDSINSYQVSEHTLGLRLSYTDLFKENINDSVSWRISDRWGPGPTAWSYYGALLGKHFTSGEPGYTESAFNSIGWDFSIERTLAVNTKTEAAFGPALKGRYYAGAGDRSEHQISGTASIDHELSPKLYLSAQSEFGLLVSSDSNFSRFVFDISGSVDYRINPVLIWSSELGLGSSSFTNRSVTTETVVSRRRGVSRTSSETSNESYSNFFMSTELTRKISEGMNARVSFTRASQRSKSGFQDFSVNELFVALLLSF